MNLVGGAQRRHAFPIKPSHAMMIRTVRVLLRRRDFNVSHRRIKMSHVGIGDSARELNPVQRVVARRRGIPLELPIERIVLSTTISPTRDPPGTA